MVRPGVSGGCWEKGHMAPSHVNLPYDQQRIQRTPRKVLRPPCVVLTARTHTGKKNIIISRQKAGCPRLCASLSNIQIDTINRTPGLAWPYRKGTGTRLFIQTSLLPALPSHACYLLHHILSTFVILSSLPLFNLSGTRKSEE